MYIYKKKLHYFVFLGSQTLWIYVKEKNKSWTKFLVARFMIIVSDLWEVMQLQVRHCDGFGSAPKLQCSGFWRAIWVLVLVEEEISRYIFCQIFSYTRYLLFFFVTVECALKTLKLWKNIKICQFLLTGLKLYFPDTG